MKRITAILLLFACLLMAGCGQIIEDLSQISSDIGSLGEPTQPETVPPSTQPPTTPVHTISFPAKLVQQSEVFLPEYAPSILFHPSGTCHMVLNMAEEMVEASGNWKVMTFADGSNLILCTYDRAISAVDTHKALFFLAEQTPGVWSFQGEGIGLTWTGGLFYPDGEETLTQETEELPVYTPGTGNYTDVKEELNTLFITKDAGDVLSFDVEWYRWTGMTGVTAYVYGNYAFFEYYIEEDGYRNDWTTGYLEFKADGTIDLNITRSDLPYMEPGTYTYQQAQQPEIS